MFSYHHERRNEEDKERLAIWECHFIPVIHIHILDYVYHSDKKLGDLYPSYFENYVIKFNENQILVHMAILEAQSYSRNP